MFLQACVCPQGGEYLTRCTHPPSGADTPHHQSRPPRPGKPPRDQVHPRTRYALPEQTPPRDQVHPPEIRPLLRTVRILLECILVFKLLVNNNNNNNHLFVGSCRDIVSSGRSGWLHRTVKGGGNTRDFQRGSQNGREK